MPARRSWTTRARIETSLSPHGVPDVLHLGRYNYTSARPGLVPHVHEQAMEFCFLVRGRQTYSVGGRNYPLSGGDIFVTYPGELHDTGGNPEEKGILYWLILRIPPASRSLLDLPPRLSRSLRAALLALPRRHFRGTWRIRERFDEIVSRHLAPATPLTSLVIHNQIVALLLDIVACADAAPSPSVTRTRPLATAIHHIATHLDEPLPLSRLATQAGLSVARFKTRFKSEHGVPPGEYILRARVAEAVRQLRETQHSVTHIAFELGFSSSQYFATVVKRYTGRTPRDLRG